MIFRRVEGRHSEVIKAWQGKTVAIFASGPSLTREHVELVREAGLKTIAVNNNYLIAPWADVLYFADRKWFMEYGHGASPEFKAFKGEVCTIEPTGNEIDCPRAHVLRNRDHEKPGVFGISDDPGAIYSGRNSGYQALSIAAHAGAKRVLLLGFDMRCVADKDHWHKPHPAPTLDSELAAYARNFNHLEKPLRDLGIEVINCCMTSRLEQFPKVPIESALASLRSDQGSACIPA